MFRRGIIHSAMMLGLTLGLLCLIGPPALARGPAVNRYRAPSYQRAVVVSPNYRAYRAPVYRSTAYRAPVYRSAGYGGYRPAYQSYGTNYRSSSPRVGISIGFGSGYSGFGYSSGYGYPGGFGGYGYPGGFGGYPGGFGYGGIGFGSPFAPF